MAQATTSILLNALRGKAGSVVFVNTKTGVTVRARKAPANPQTPLQVATRTAMNRASRLFSTFDPLTAQAWKDYARTLQTYDASSGRLKVPSGQNVFAGLCCKLWQMDNTQDVPLTPPAAAFLGDGITVTVGVDRGRLAFYASGNNAENVVTELLVQPLRSGAVTPQKRAYRNAGFVEFALRQREGFVLGLSGCVACAVRYVRLDTGQSSPLLELGVVYVGETGTFPGGAGPLPTREGGFCNGQHGNSLPCSHAAPRISTPSPHDAPRISTPSPHDGTRGSNPVLPSQNPPSRVEEMERNAPVPVEEMERNADAARQELTQKTGIITAQCPKPPQICSAPPCISTANCRGLPLMSAFSARPTTLRTLFWSG